MKQTIKQNGLALIAGIIFGVGLGLSQMIDRQRVLGFLDLAGNWDPTLLFVLGGAVAVTVISFRFVLNRNTPLLSAQFYVPTRQDIDWRLIAGAALFGIGWGIAGYCPGPGIAALATGDRNPVFFLLSMVAGMIVFNHYDQQQQQTKSQNTGPTE
ncbi:MAG: DUF6691 family protein [Cyanobacteria bacterium J06553_1]